MPAAVAAGVSPRDPSIRRAVGWLATHQNADGGWGEDLRSYDDPEVGAGAARARLRRPPGRCWPACRRRASSPAVARGVAFLCETQAPSGTWDEPFYTGTGFPGDFYINYHLYRLVFPLQALGRYVQAVGAAGDRDGRT